MTVTKIKTLNTLKIHQDMTVLQDSSYEHKYKVVDNENRLFTGAQLKYSIGKLLVRYVRNVEILNSSKNMQNIVNYLNITLYGLV